MTSEIRTNSLKSRAGLSTVTLTDSGPMFSGITTFVDNSGFNFGVGTGSSIFTPASNTLTLGTNSNESIRINSSGNVGLGVNNPTRKLDVSGDVLGNAFMLRGNTSASPSIQAQMFRPENDTLAFATNGNNERLRIDSSGRVLLGHTASVPTGGSATAHFKLQVQGINFEASGIFQQRYQNGTAGASLYLGHSRGAIGVHTALQQDDEVGKVAFVASDGTDFAGQAGRIQCLMAANATSDDTPGHLTFNTCPSGSNSTLERLRIASGGNIGINESSPAARLHISSPASTTCELRLTANNTGSGAGDRGRINVYSSRNDGTAYQAGYVDIDRSSGTEDKAHLSVALNNGSGVGERLRITSTGQTKLNIASDGALTEPLVIRNGGSGGGANVGMVFYNGNESSTGAGALARIKAIDVGNYDSDLVFETGLKSGWGNSTTERLRIGSTGLVKISQPGAITDGSFFSTITISSPNGVFQGLRFDRGSIAKWRIGMKNDDTFQIANLFNNGSVGAEDNTLRITDNNNISMVGKLGIQVTSPSHELDLGGTALNQDDGTEYTLRIRSNNGKTAIRVGSGGGGSRVNLMRFDGDSNPGSGVGCSGDTDAGAYGGTLVYHGDRSGNENSFAVYMDQSNNATQIEAFNIRQNGDYMHGGSSYSDRDQKENITAISGTALDKITQLSPKTWNWKPEYHDIPTDRIFAGFIAQEVQPHIPSIVTGTDGQGDMALDYQGLLAWTIKAVTELNSKVDTLEQENITLRARITNLEGN